jgi:hypothetical protein
MTSYYYTTTASPFSGLYAQLQSYLTSMYECADNSFVLATMLSGLDQLVDILKDEIDDQIARMVPI